MESPRHIENLKEQYKINFGNITFANFFAVKFNFISKRMEIVPSESWPSET